MYDTITLDQASSAIIAGGSVLGLMALCVVPTMLIIHYMTRTRG